VNITPLGSGKFLRDVGSLFVGTSGAQAIALALYPLFTRVFSPAQFGELAWVTTVSSVVAIVSTGALECAIITTRSPRVASDLMRWIFLRALVVVSFFGVLALCVLSTLGSVAPDVGLGWVAASVLFALLTVFTNCLSEWMVRSAAFGSLSRFRILQSGLVATVKASAGLLSSPVNGLVLGEVLGRSLSAGAFVLAWRRSLNVWDRRAIGRARAAGLRFKLFPRVHLPDQLLNVVGGVIHVPLIGMAFGTRELGLVSVVLSALYLPVTVMSSAIKDVFRLRISEEFRRTGTCRQTYVEVLRWVALFSAIGFALAYLVVEEMFTFFFGREWSDAGRYAEIMIPMFYMNFVSMSVGGVFVITRRLQMSLLWQATGLALAVCALCVGIFVFRTIEATLWAFSIARALSYGLHMLLSYHVAGISSQSVDRTRGGKA
jgi:O-antigen/teichoic acid export membrane protein